MKRMIDGTKANELLKLNENVVADGTTTQVGGDLEVDGKITVNSIDDIKAGKVYLQQRLTAGNNIKISGNTIEAEINKAIFEIKIAFDANVEGGLVITGLSDYQFLLIKNGIANAISRVVGSTMTWETAIAYLANNWTNIGTSYRTALFTELFNMCFAFGFQMNWRISDGEITKILANYSSVGHVYALTANGTINDCYSSMINSTEISIGGQEVVISSQA